MATLIGSKRNKVIVADSATINTLEVTTNITEGATLLSDKYLTLSGGTLTGDLSITTNSDSFRLGKDLYETDQPGLAIRPADETNPDDGDTLFVVRSGGGSPRFFTEHEGRVGSTNQEFYLGTNSDRSGGKKVWHTGDFSATVIATWDSAYAWGDHSTQSYATQDYVGTQIASLVDSSPEALDTLNELAAALGDDPNFASTVTESIATKLPLAGGTLTGKIIFETASTNNGFQWNVNSDSAGITFKNSGDGDANSNFNFFTKDNGNEYFKFSHTTWDAGTLDYVDIKNGATRFNGELYANAEQSGDVAAGTNKLINGNPLFHSGNFGKEQIDALNVDADTLDGYDSDVFGKLISNQDWEGSNQFSATDTSGHYSSAAIEIREVGEVTNNQSAINYAPAMSFHWGMRYSGRLAMAANGDFYLQDGTAFTDYRNLFAGDLYDNGDRVFSAGNFGKEQIDGLDIDASTLDGYDNTAFGKLSDNQTWTGVNTFTGGLVAESSDPYPLVISKSTNSGGVGIKFTDLAQTNPDQHGFIDYFHSDTLSYGSGNAFVYRGDQPSMSHVFDVGTNNDGLQVKVDGSAKDVHHAGNFGKTEIDALNIDADTLDGQDSEHYKNNGAYNYKDITVGGDADTYYPITIGSGNSMAFGMYSISRRYNWTAPSTWHNATHEGGLTLTWRASGDGEWGGNDKAWRVEQFDETYSTMVGGMDLLKVGMTVWLRGGTAQYRITTPRGASQSVTNRTTGFNDTDGVAYVPYTNNTLNSQVYDRFPVRDNGRLHAIEDIRVSGKDLVDVGRGRFQYGTAATPSITFEADSDTGFYRYDTDQLGVAAGGSTQLRFSSGSYGLNMHSSIHMNSNHVNYAAGLHFNSGARFYDYNSAEIRVAGSSSYGALRFTGTDAALKGKVYWSATGFGLINSAGTWGVLTTATQTNLYHQGNAIKLETEATGIKVNGKLTASSADIEGSLHVKQSADSSGIRLFGHDDKSTYSGNIYVDPNGNFRINQTHGAGTGYIQIEAENYLQLEAASLIYTQSNFRVYDAGCISLGNGGDYKIKYNATADNLTIQTNDNKGLTIDNAGNTTSTGSLLLQTDNADGLLFERGGTYTDGRYRTRFRKQDVGGGIPLYIDQSDGTANNYTTQARFGTYTGNTYEFEVFGNINATGNLYSNNDLYLRTAQQRQVKIDSSISFADVDTSCASGVHFKKTTSSPTIVAFGSHWNGAAESITNAFVVGTGSTWYNGDLLKLTATGSLTVAGDIYSTGTFYYGDTKKMFQFDDTWLRINPVEAFTAGIYCGQGKLRTDGQFEVGSNGDKFKVTSAGVVTVAGSVTATGNITTAGDITVGVNKILSFPTSTSAGGAYIKTINANVNGANLIISSGGNTVVGSGEGTGNNAVASGSTSENLHLGSDNTIYMHVGAQTWADRKTHTLSTNGDVSFIGKISEEGEELEDKYQAIDTTASFTYTGSPTDEWVEILDIRSLTDGTWIVEVSTHSTNLNFWYMRWSGTVAISSANGTNDTDYSSEVPLHNSGHSAGGRELYLRTTMHPSAGTEDLTLDMKITDASIEEGTFTIKFRKLI